MGNLVWPDSTYHKLII